MATPDGDERKNQCSLKKFRSSTQHKSCVPIQGQGISKGSAYVIFVDDGFDLQRPHHQLNDKWSSPAFRAFESSELWWVEAANDTFRA